MDDKIVQTRRSNQSSKVVSPKMCAIDIILQRLLPSERQSRIRTSKNLFDLLRLSIKPAAELNVLYSWRAFTY